MDSKHSYIAIDTDPGIDDALALLFAFNALRAYPQQRIPLITTVGGNVPLDKVTHNARRILSLACAGEVPALVRGAGRPLRRRLVNAANVHGNDGLGGMTRITTPSGKPRYPSADHIPIRSNAGQALNKFARTHGVATTMVALGPLTNIARALMLDPDALRQIDRLIIMGGSISVGGNISPAAEYNFYADPDAADLVLNSGLNITLVPLDVTHQLVLTPDSLEHAISGHRGKQITAVRDMTKRLFKERGVLHLHDPLALMLAFDPSLVKTQPLLVRVDTDSKQSLGASIADRRPSSSVEQGPRIDVALEVDQTRALALFLEHLIAAPLTSPRNLSAAKIVVAEVATSI